MQRANQSSANLFLGGGLQILLEAASFGANSEELKDIYILIIESILEQSCIVWNKSLAKEDILNLERVQKSAVRII